MGNDRASRNTPPQRPAKQPTLTQLYAALCEACGYCRDEAAFAALARTWLRRLVPHGMLIAAIGRIDADHVQILRTIGVDAPCDALARAPRRLDLRERPGLQCWVEKREPQIFLLPCDADRMSSLERDEIRAFDLGNIAMHGVMDRREPFGSCFIFCRLGDELHPAEVLETLCLVTPLLHQALMSIHARAIASGEAPPR